MKTDDKNVIREILGADFTKNILVELGIQNSTLEEQATLMQAVGGNIERRIMLEILTILPESDRDEFEGYIGSKDIAGFREFLTSRIPDLEEFVRRHAVNEYEATKTELHKIRQGVTG